MALNAAVVWEVQTGGSDNNGGGFKAGATGTDRSQQTTAQVAINNASITTSITTNVITFTGGYSPSSADVGNVVQMLTGTNVTAGFYEITSIVAGTSWTVDRNVVTSGTTTNATGNMGGCLASPGKAAGAMVSSNTMYIKTGTYTLGSASANVATGTIAFTSGAPTITIEGYGATRGDLSSPPSIVNAAFTSINIVSSTSGSLALLNVIVDGNSQSTVTGVNLNSANAQGLAYAVTAKNCTNGGFASTAANRGACVRCSATGCATVAAFVGGLSCIACEAYSNTVTGFSLNAGAAVNCLSYSNSGASSDGFTLQNQSVVSSSSTYGNGRDGFRMNSGNTGTCVSCYAEANTGVGFRANAANLLFLQGCATYNNTGGSTAGTPRAISGVVTLSASGFSNAGSNDFSLNGTVGAGASLRAAGYPGLFPRGTTTGYLDIGAVQHADPAALRFNLFASPIVRVVEPS